MSSTQLVVESHEGRRVLARLSQGEELHKRLLDIARRCGVRAATVRGTGVLDEVALAHYDRSSRAIGKSRRLRGSLMLLSLEGSISEHDGRTDVQLNAMVSRDSDNGIEVLGGLITGARVVAVEVVLEVMDDVMLRRRLDRSSGLHVWSDLIGAEPTRPATTHDEAARVLEAQADRGRARVAEAASAQAAFARGASTSSSSPSSSPSSSGGDGAAPSSGGDSAAPGSGNGDGAAAASEASSAAADAGYGDGASASDAAVDLAGSAGEGGSDGAGGAGDGATLDERWAAAAAASSEAQAVAEDDDYDDEIYRAIQPGDLLDHVKFGRCVVERVDVNEEFATVRLRNNRLVRLNIEVLNLSYQGDEDGHQVFSTNPRG